MRSLELKIPPLVVLVFVAALMWFSSREVPAAGIHLPAREVIALVLAAIGVGTAVAGLISFRIAKTTVNPLKPQAASTLVTSGIYKRTRNPMYLGALVLLLGWAAFLANALAVVFVPSFVLYMNRFQIIPVERALNAVFTLEFATYRAQVRRWL